MNRGTRALAERWLTLRGGIDPRLSEYPDSTERARRRVLVARSWLTVEDARGAPARYIVAHVRAATTNRASSWQTLHVLERILVARGVGAPEVASWLSDCRPALTAEIRRDGCWVNRAAAFADLFQESPISAADVWDLVGWVFGGVDGYFAPAANEEGHVELRGEPALVQKARAWLSARFGTGPGVDFARLADRYARIAQWAEQAAPGVDGQEAMSQLTSALGVDATPDAVRTILLAGNHRSATQRQEIPRLASLPVIERDDLDRLALRAVLDAQSCREKCDRKGHRATADALLAHVEAACGIPYRWKRGARTPSRLNPYVVIFDLAARRLAAHHTKVKRAERDRSAWIAHLPRVPIPASASAWLDAYRLRRGCDLGVLDEHEIRPRALGGWREIVTAWARPGCRSVGDRVRVVRAGQSDPAIRKYGDHFLFESLAEEGAESVWRGKEGTSAAVLESYVAARDAAARARRCKAPVYVHPDPFFHPVFVDFGRSRWKIEFAIHRRQRDTQRKPARSARPRSEASAPAQWLSDPQALALGLWNGVDVVRTPLRWQSKRVARELLSGSPANAAAVPVPRVTRLGRAASGATDADVVDVVGLFDRAIWPARLMAPRSALARMGRCVEALGGRWDDTARGMRDRLVWRLDLSVELTPDGPWMRYALPHGLSADPTHLPHAAVNQRRRGQARLLLSRLPGLRVLAAHLRRDGTLACAVWEALAPADLDDLCRRAGVQAPTGDAFHGSHEHEGRKVVLRRVGADRLPDGSPHPAPWARLEREFVIRLPGDDPKRDVRKASPAELAAVRDFTQAVGFRSPVVPRRSVAELMAHALRRAEEALRRHGDSARIAFGLADEVALPSGERQIPRSLEAVDEVSAQVGAERVVAGLTRWYERVVDERWIDEEARAAWSHRIEPLGAWASGEAADDRPATRAESRRRFEERLAGVARHLTDPHEAGTRSALARWWRDRWYREDAEWPGYLRWLRRWILPRSRAPEIRDVGGLSLRRIETMRRLWRLDGRFSMRPRPEDLRAGIPGAGEGASRRGARIRAAAVRLRKARERALASELVSRALGFDRRHEHRTAPCPVVVLVDRSSDAPDQCEPRRFNRRLSLQAASGLRGKVWEACNLHGIQLRWFPELGPARWNSRTAEPALRCSAVSPAAFLAHRSYWSDRLAEARHRLMRARAAAAEPDPRDLYCVSVADALAALPSDDRRRLAPIWIPDASGAWVLDAEGYRGSADLHAASDLAVRVLTDPDWPGGWISIPTTLDLTGRRIVDCERAHGATWLETWSIASGETPGLPLRPRSLRRRSRLATPLTDAKLVLWRAAPKASLDEVGWLPFGAWQRRVAARVLDRLREGLPADLRGTLGAGEPSEVAMRTPS